MTASTTAFTDVALVRTYTAKFPPTMSAFTARRQPGAVSAAAFAARLAEGGFHAENIKHSRATVTWTVNFTNMASTPAEYFADLRETAGYYGSTASKKATLNGVSCPVIY